jgi:restriction system protein
MPRLRTSAFDDLLTLASRLPWKVSMGLAAISFIVLHIIASNFGRAVTATSTADLGGVVIRQYIHVFAMLLQFILPVGFLVGAVVSLVKRSHSKALLDNVRGGAGRDISSLSWKEFETLVAEGFRCRGFDVENRGGSGPDGGIDLVLRRGHEKSLVQCKQWRARQVGVSIIRELYGVMAAESAAGGHVVTSGSFTKDAAQFAQGRNIELVDGAHLDQLLREPLAPDQTANAFVKQRSESIVTPTCPGCKGPMVERLAKRGPNLGKPFWGCRSYPKCRGTLPITR